MLGVMRVRGVGGAVSRVCRMLTSVGVTGVARVSTACTMTAVSDVPELGEPSHRHRGEPGAAESEAEAIEIHIPNTTCWRACW